MEEDQAIGSEAETPGIPETPLQKARAKKAENQTAQVVHNHMRLLKRPKAKKRKNGLSGGLKNIDAFLYPPMPGAFTPSDMRKKDLMFRAERYLKTFAATMGNHSISLFYTSWRQDEFDAAIEQIEGFAGRIAEEKNRLADRAQFFLHKTMGLIPQAGELDEAHKVNDAALARVVEKINEGRTDTRPAGKGLSLRVDGLERPKRNTP